MLALLARASITLKKANVKFPTNYFHTYFLSEKRDLFPEFPASTTKKQNIIIYFYKYSQNLHNYLTKN